MKPERAIDVLALGYYGFGNFGDELLAKAVVSLLIEAGVPRERIALLSASPKQGQEELGVACYDRWNLGTAANLMKQSRSFLLGGGGLFQDTTSVRSCGYYWWMAKTAKFSGAKLWAVSQSIGPLRHFLSKRFAKSSFRLCEYISVRDDRAEAQLDRWKIACSKALDLALTLDIKRREHKGKDLLLNLRPGYPKLSEKALKCAKHTAERDGLDIVGVALSREDEAYLEKLKADGAVRLKKITLLKTIDDFEKTARQAAKAIGMRLHFAELAAKSGVGFLAAAYDPKVEAFCERWKLPMLTDDFSDKFNTVDLEEFEKETERAREEFKNALRSVLGNEG